VWGPGDNPRSSRRGRGGGWSSRRGRGGGWSSRRGRGGGWPGVQCPAVGGSEVVEPRRGVGSAGPVRMGSPSEPPVGARDRVPVGVIGESEQRQCRRHGELLRLQVRPPLGASVPPQWPTRTPLLSLEIIPLAGNQAPLICGFRGRVGRHAAAAQRVPGECPVARQSPDATRLEWPSEQRPSHTGRWFR
jgi:hypothetical protein